MKLTEKQNNHFKFFRRVLVTFVVAPFLSTLLHAAQEKHLDGLPLYYWKEGGIVNFGDTLSLKLVERIVGDSVRVYRKTKKYERKLLAIGSIFYFAADQDVVWGSGINGKRLNKHDYKFKRLDIRSVRGPLTRKFLKENFHIEAPAIYGDPALLLPYFFPEFKKKSHPSREYIVIPHYSEEKLFPKTESNNVVYSTDPWEEILEKILDSKLVISTSLHGVIVAEAYGIPARMMRVTENEPLFKYQDYYLGTNRPNFEFATSVEEALQMGGEVPGECDLRKIYEAFPFELWPDREFQEPDFFKRFF